MPGALTGVRVLELAHIMAGPVCGLMLADMGADVVKVERLPHGDGSRSFVPPDVRGESAAFMMLNRGKRGLAVDVRTASGIDIVRRLAADADVLVENFRVGTMERMGLGWDVLSADNPRLVYCQITGFGRTGPLAHQGGFDLIAQGYAGLMSVTGSGDGGEPVKVGAPVTDITAGILAAFGVSAALFERERTGRGQLVDTSLLEAGIAQTYWQSAIALASGVSPGALGSAHPLSAPYQAFRTADGWVNVGASNQATWLRLVEAVGAPALASDPRFESNADRMAHLTELVDELSGLLVTRSTDDWLEVFDRGGVPAGPVASIGEMLEHPQVRARDMVIEVEHRRAGRVRSLGAPLKMSGVGGASGPERGVATASAAGVGAGSASAARAESRPVSGGPRRGAPLLGEHTRAVLAEAGWTAAQVEELLADGVIAAAD